MSGIEERITPALESYFDDVRKDGYIVDGVTGAEAASAVIEASSWDLLMAILDRHYPADIFPTMEDREDRDPGPRIVSLLRRIGAVRELHRERHFAVCDTGPRCEPCDSEWPCATLAALDSLPVTPDTGTSGEAR